MNKYKNASIMMFSVVFLLLNYNAIGQVVNTPANTYIVVAKQGSDEAKVAAEALQKTDFNNYRLRSIHRKIIFFSGVIIELLSAEEMVKLGYKVNPINYPEKIDANYVEPIYSVSSSGILMQLHQNSNSPSKSKIN